jgi:3-oxoacyl-[acyl-carrier protein] reductase
VSYGAAKAALESYTLSAAAELASLGVTANVVHPPVTDTGWLTPEIAAAIQADGPFGAIAAPRDVAGVVAWLCSDEARWITGLRLDLRAGIVE